MLAWHHPSSFQSKLGKGRQVRHTVSDILLWISLFRVCIITRDKTLGELQISRRKWCWETEHSESQELQIVQHRVKTPLLLRLMSRQALYTPHPDNPNSGSPTLQFSNSFHCPSLGPVLSLKYGCDFFYQVFQQRADIWVPVLLQFLPKATSFLYTETYTAFKPFCAPVSLPRHYYRCNLPVALLTKSLRNTAVYVNSFLFFLFHLKVLIDENCTHLCLYTMLLPHYGMTKSSQLTNVSPHLWFHQ